MRAIKFRGYDAVGKKGWVYGDLVHNMKVTTTGVTPRTMVGGYEVFPESVGQFTGRKDRDGNDIYEGDCLREKELFYSGYKGPVFTVKYSEGDGCFFLQTLDPVSGKKISIYLPAYPYAVVIGTEFNPKSQPL